MVEKFPKRGTMGRGRPRGSGAKIQWKKRTAFIDLYVPPSLRTHFEGRASVRRYLGAVEPAESHRLAAEIRLEHEQRLRSLENPDHDRHRLAALASGLMATALEKGLTIKEMLSLAPVVDHEGILHAIPTITPPLKPDSAPILRVGSLSPTWSPETLESTQANARRKIERVYIMDECQGAEGANAAGG